MAICKNFNTINSSNINEIKIQLSTFERYAFIHTTSSKYRYTYHCTIKVSEDNCYTLSLVDTFSYDFIDYSNLTFEEVCIILQSHNLSGNQTYNM